MRRAGLCVFLSAVLSLSLYGNTKSLQKTAAHCQRLISQMEGAGLAIIDWPIFFSFLKRIDKLRYEHDQNTGVYLRDPRARLELDISNDYRLLLTVADAHRENLALVRDAELGSLAQTEADARRNEFTQTFMRLRYNVVRYLDPASEGTECLVEIDAAGNGIEAERFVTQLVKMYEGVAHNRDWSYELLSGEVGTRRHFFKKAILKVTGPGVFADLRNETGIHRFKGFEPDRELREVKYPHVDVQVQVWRGGTPEERHRLLLNETAVLGRPYRADNNADARSIPNAMEFIHLPTGIRARSSYWPTLEQNRIVARALLEQKVLAVYRDRIPREQSIDTTMVNFLSPGQRTRTQDFALRQVVDNITGQKFPLSDDRLGPDAIDAFTRTRNGYVLNALVEGWLIVNGRRISTR
jgi:protein subunit release factor A